MPENTRVHRCVEKVKKDGHDEGSAIAICQKSTGQSFATGKGTRKSDGKKVSSPKSESKMLPSIRVMTIAAADPALFESLMRQAGFRLARRNTDPLNNHVQVESVQAVASAMMEDNYFGVRLDPYRRKLKNLAESRGYVVVIENCGPPGADPCEGDLPPGPDGPPDMGGEMPVAEVGEGEALMADNPEGTPMPMGPPEDMASGPSEVEQVASLPIGTELAQQILDVIQGKGTAALDEPDFGGEDELPPMEDEGDEFPPEEGGEDDFGGPPNL